MVKLYLIFTIITFYLYNIIIETVTGDNLQCLNCKSWNCINEDEFCQNDGENRTRNDSKLCEIKDRRIRALQCFDSDGLYPCQGLVSPSTIVTFKCPSQYVANSTISMCLRDGSWSHPITCKPECGRISPEVLPLIMHGTEPQTSAQWPWAAALHRRNQDGSWELICGGTLITDNLVITAAHCVHNVVAKNLKVVLGYLSRKFPERMKTNLVYKVKRIYVLPVYRGSMNSYNSDIAIMVLASIVHLSKDIRPACLPDQRITVTPYTMAFVAGWGLDENLKKSERLKYVQVPIIDSLKCIKHVPVTFTRYLSYSAFCAGYLNGTGVCNGDSGSGLMTQVDGKWVIQGVISISPRKGTANVCHPYSFSLYTKVMIYIDWIKKVIEFEQNKQYEEDKLLINNDKT